MADPAPAAGSTRTFPASPLTFTFLEELLASGKLTRNSGEALSWSKYSKLHEAHTRPSEDLRE